jgi:hypothetical protein
MHHPTPAAPAGDTGNLSTWRLQYWHTGQCIRLHCNPAVARFAPFIVALRCTPEQASRFGSAEAAHKVAKTFLPNELLHAVRVDA